MRGVLLRAHPFRSRVCGSAESLPKLMNKTARGVFLSAANQSLPT